MLLRMVLNSNQPQLLPLQPRLVTLDRLAVGQPAIVADIAGEEPEMVRLRVMGLCVGQGVHTLRAGPRMIVCVGGTRIGMTSEVARAVTVRPLDETPACRL